MSGSGFRFRQALAAHQRGDIAGAASQYQAILRAVPNHVEALNMLGVAALQSGNAEQGIALIGRAVALKPNYADAQYNLAVALGGQHRFADALAGYDKVVALAPRHADAWMNRGAVLAELGRHADAVASYDRAIACKPNNGEAFANRAVALCALRRFAEAAESCTKAIAMRPDYADAFYNRSIALRDQGKFPAALADCDRAIALRPDFAKAHANRGAILGALQRLADALASSEAAIAIDPGLAEAHCHRADVLRLLRRNDEALAAYDTALARRPDFPGALVNRGGLLRELNRPADAARDFAQALRIEPDIAFTRGDLLFTNMQICAWDSIEQDRQDLTNQLLAGQPASPPFPVVAAIDSPSVQLQAARLWIGAGQQSGGRAYPAIPRPAGDRIRLAYFSSDYRNHATAHLAAGLFETHDRDAFEVIGVSFGPDTNDPIRTRIKTAFDRFIDADRMADQAVADMARELGIDIAIDLNGLTRNARTGVFAARAAPVQVNYLGYPGTMGADFMDYIVADPTVIPDDSRAHYAEKIIYLPHSYQINDAARAVSATTPTRSDLGLPDTGIVFCCFNNNYKILPDVFDSWMRILHRCPASVLWLLRDNDLAAEALRREAAARGVDPMRLIFAPRVGVAAHLARHRAADLFLDTFPYNAHTTGSDALWMGLPVLTRMGASFACRVAASLLRATGLPELITETAADFEDSAVRLAGDPPALAALRARLLAGRAAAPLFDTVRYVRHLESAWRTIHERRLAGRPAEDVSVGA